MKASWTSWISWIPGGGDPLDVRGISSIDGRSEKNIAAAGSKGEIWLFDGRWKIQDSPTNVLLYGVRWLDDRTCFACGQSGIIVKGEDRAWTVVEHDLTTADYVGMEAFRDLVYLVCEGGIHVLRHGEEPRPIGKALKESERFKRLHAGNGALWAFGADHLAWTTDGVTWRETELKLP